MKIFELLNPKDMQKLKRENFAVVDKFVAEDYEFYLVYRSGDKHGYQVIPFYQIAVQRVGKSFVDINQQMSKEPLPIGKIPIRLIALNIQNWLDKYHKIYIGSMNPRKLKFG